MCGELLETLPPAASSVSSPGSVQATRTGRRRSASESTSECGSQRRHTQRPRHRRQTGRLRETGRLRASHPRGSTNSGATPLCYCYCHCIRVAATSIGNQRFTTGDVFATNPSTSPGWSLLQGRCFNWGRRRLYQLGGREGWVVDRTSQPVFLGDASLLRFGLVTALNTSTSRQPAQSASPGPQSASTMGGQLIKRAHRGDIDGTPSDIAGG